jgi:hypothetical protein
MDNEKIKNEFMRLGVRDAAHHIALQAIISEGPPEMRDKLRRMASRFGDLALATAIPDEWHTEFQRTLLSVAGFVILEE